MDKVYIEVPELARDAVRKKLRELFGDDSPIDCPDACLVFVGMPSLFPVCPCGHNLTDCYGPEGYRKITLDEFFKMKPETKHSLECRLERLEIMVKDHDRILDRMEEER